MADGLITYDDAARWLPDDVRERIAITRPCSEGQAHNWEHYAYEISTFDSAFPMTREWWQCDRCRTVVKTDPEATQP